MKVRIEDLINNRPYCVDSEELFDELKIQANTYEYIDLEDHGFSGRYIESWICTDTRVGHGVLFYEDEPIAVTLQTARKSDIKFFWFDKDIRKKIYDICLSQISNKYDDSNVSYVDINEVVLR